jgi:hypothetical protein
MTTVITEKCRSLGVQGEMKTKLPIRNLKKAALVICFLIASYALFLILALPGLATFQLKARHSEIRGNLSAIASGEKSYAVEWHQYSTDLVDIGFSPEGRLSRVYGFSPHCPRDSQLSSFSGAADAAALRSHTVTTNRRVQRFFDELPCPTYFPQSYEAYAVSDPSIGLGGERGGDFGGDFGGEKLDIWKLSSHGEITLIQDAEPIKSWRDLRFHMKFVLAMLAGFGILSFLFLSVSGAQFSRLWSAISYGLLTLVTIVLFYASAMILIL